MECVQCVLPWHRLEVGSQAFPTLTGVHLLSQWPVHTQEFNSTYQLQYCNNEKLQIGF